MPGNGTRSPAARALLAAIGSYQRHLSRDHSWWARGLGLPPYCRYVPSCSQYARGAVGAYGALRGGWMAFRRVLRCHPWARGGHDPVPPLDAAQGARMVKP